MRGIFVGRERDRAALSALVERGARLLTITGPPGIGKTRLAVELAPALARASGASDDDIAICDMTAARGVEGMCSALASSLRVPLGPDAVDHIGRVLARRGPSLLVLDNVEHLVEHAAQTIGSWCSRATNVTFVITSREALHLAPEHVHALEPLSLPEGGDDLLGSEAGALFAARARDARHGYTLPASDKAVIAAIVRRLEGIPLAIDLAASFMAHLSASQVAARFAGDLDAEAAAWTGASPRHATLRAAIAVSWDLLPPIERAMLAQITVFRGGFDLEAAEAVLDGGGVARALGALQHRSLVRAYEPATAPDRVRFATYESIREFAANELAEADRARAIARHAEHYLTRGEALADRVDGPDGSAALAELRLDAENLAAVLDASLASDPIDAERAIRAALVLEEAEVKGASATARRARFDRVIAAATQRTSPVLAAKALIARARILRRCGPLEDARADLARALARIEGLDRRDIEARIAWDRGLLTGEAGRREEGRVELERALDQSREVGDRAVEGGILLSLGALARLDGRVLEAEERCEHARSVLREAGRKRSEGAALFNLASLRGDMNRDDAGALHEQAIAAARALDQDEVVAGAIAGLGAWQHRRGLLAEARRSHDEALSLLRRIGDHRLEAIVLGNAATLRHEEGDAEGARATYEDAIVIARAAGMRHAEVIFTAMLAGALASTDLIGRSIAVFEDAERGLAAIGRDPLGAALLALQRAHLDLAESRRAARDGDADRAKIARASALDRIAVATGRAGDVEIKPALVDQWGDAAVTVRMLRARIEREPLIEASSGRTVLDGRADEIRFGGQTLSLKRRPVLRKMLFTLASARGAVVKKEALCEAIFEHPYAAHRDDNPLRVNMNRLRALLEPTDLRVESEGGYRLVAPNGFLLIQT